VVFSLVLIGPAALTPVATSAHAISRSSIYVTPATDLDYFAWVWPDNGVLAIMATSRPDLAPGFGPAFLEAQS
jgi:hypothetical protein